MVVNYAAGTSQPNNICQCLHSTNLFRSIKVACTRIIGAGTGNVEIIIIDPHGEKDSTKPRIARSTETTYYVEYLPKDVGRYTIHIFFASKEIPSSPYPVNVGARKYR